MKRMVWTSFSCQQFRKDKLFEHQRSKSHADAAQMEATAIAARRTGGIHAVVGEQVCLQRQAVKGALKCTHWLAKEEIALYTKFPSLLNLGKLLGCSYLHELDIAGNAHYTSNRMIDEFLTVLSQCVENDILVKVRASPVTGILCNESTDVANLKQLAIFVRFLDEGKPHTCFLKMVDIVNGTAETIEHNLLDVCGQCEISSSTIFSFGSDGAPVMTGKQTGVATHMKVLNPEMLYIHCGPHRVALATSQAAIQVEYRHTFDSNLTSLHYFFANSPIWEAALHEVQKIHVVEEPVLRLKKAVHTRWLSHEQAIIAIRRTMPALIVALEREVTENDNAIACGLVTTIKSYKLVATVYLLSDILPHLSVLNLVFQREVVDLSIIKPQVSATIASLNFIRSNPGLHMQELEEVVSDLTSRFGLIVQENSKENFNKNVQEKYINCLVDNLENRISDSAILGALETLFNSKKASSAGIEGYGNVAIEQYPMTVVKKDLQREWLAFKHILIDVFAEASTSEVMTTISSDASYSSLYPTLSKLAGITLTLPVSTAHVERGFSTTSCMKRIKTDLRNRLKTETLDKLIRLSSEGPSLKIFDYEAAVDLWASKSNRRIYTYIM